MLIINVLRIFIYTKLMKFKNSFLFLLPLLFLFSCEQNSKIAPKVTDGTLDLRTWDFEKYGNVKLDGEWEFYWKQLLEPKDFHEKRKSEYIYVKKFGTWSQGGGAKKYSEFGYATYRVKILLPKMKENPKIHFKLLNLYSSSKLWLNDTEVFELGKVGTSLETSEPAFCVFRNLLDKQQYILENDTLEIVIQSSDYFWGKGGLRACKIGLAEQIHVEVNTKIIYDSFLLGILFIIGIYHFFLFFFRKKEQSTLFFALLCVVVFLRALSVTGFTFDFFSFETSIRLIYFWIPIYPFLLIKFLSKLYPEESNRKSILITAIISITICLFDLFTPIQYIKKSEIFVGLLILIVLFYLLLVVNIKAIRSKKQGVWVSFIGIVILIIGVVNDLLFIKGISFGLNFLIIQLTFVIYIVLQAINIAERFSISFKMNEQLNKNLERIVEERTIKIQQQKDEIFSQNEELRQQQEEVIMINESLEKQHLELQNKNTDIMDSIHYARTIQKAILPTQNYRKEVFPNSFLIYRPKDIVSGDFFWIKVVGNMSFIACVDCTGHGVPGAFMSVIGNDLLNEAIDHKQYKPSEILNYLGENIRVRLNQAENNNFDGMDISICRFEKMENSKTKLLYAGAKSAIYLIQNNEMSSLKGDRKSIGGMRVKLDFSFQDFEIELKKGNMIYMSSDGYTDQANEGRKRFGSLRFRELIKSLHQFSIEEQKEILKEELDMYQGKEEQIDDITVIGIQI